MGFLNKYPYTDFNELNLDWVLQKIKEFQDTLENAKAVFLDEAKEYTDLKFANFQDQINELETEMNLFETLIQNDMQQFEQLVNGQINIIRGDIADFKDFIASEIVGINARTDFAIAQNNVYILNELSKFLAQIEVLNYFTGRYVTVQEMFDYLSMLHAENGIIVSDLIERVKTVSELIALNISYTDIAKNGNTLIV